MEHLIYGFETKALEEDGSFKGYASVFDVIDSDHDVIVKGAFQESLAEWGTKGSLPSLLWQHRTDQPIGIYTVMKEDAIGLYVEGKLALDVQQGKEAHALMKMGALSGISIGYRTIDYTIDTAKGYRVLSKLALFEASLVTFPANDKARVSQVKGDHTVRGMEKRLRDAGLSNADAKTAATLFKWSLNLRDEEEVLNLKAAFDAAIKALNSKS